MDVNLISKDMELNFSNKNEDEDELLENVKTVVNTAASALEAGKGTEFDEIEEEPKGLKFEEEKDFQMKKVVQPQLQNGK